MNAFTMPLSRECVGRVLQAIYNTELPVRLEYIWDGGWTWVLLGHDPPLKDEERPSQFPRLWIDEQMHGGWNVCCMSEESQGQMESIPVMEKDWVARGNERTIEEAVESLAREIARRYPGYRSILEK